MSDTTAPKPFVFVLMPFSKEFDDVYELGIKQACKNAGAYAERVDEQEYEEIILDRIYNQIAKADVIVADMTGQNPNVFYETGYAHALNKRVILITRNADDIPFDLKHYAHIVYEGRIADTLLPQLERKVRWNLDQGVTAEGPEGPELEFYIDGVSLANNPQILYNTNNWAWEFKLDIHNPLGRHPKTQTCQLGFQTTHRIFEAHCSVPDNWDELRVNKVVQQDGGFLHLVMRDYEILPGAWDSLMVQLYPEGGDFVSPDDEEVLTVEVFTESGKGNFFASLTGTPITSD